MPAHELQLTYGRRVNPIQHYQIPRPHGNQPEVKQKEGTEMNDFAFNAINSNSEERTSSMSDYSTSTTPDETRYQENTPTVTPEIVDDIDDADLVETNPVAALAGNFQDDELTVRPITPSRRLVRPPKTSKSRFCMPPKPNTIWCTRWKRLLTAISGSRSDIRRA